MPPPSPWTLTRLAWQDRELGTIALPARPLVLHEGFGSGLATRSNDPPGTVWAVCDRGPNLKVRDAARSYGADWLAHLSDREGAKIMPRLDLGPAVAELRVFEDSVELVRVIRLCAGELPLPGTPIPAGEGAACEPAFALDGEPIPPDPAGADTEGIAALADGGFWLGDEYGPSLLKADAEGKVVLRLVPGGCRERLAGAGYPVEERLPALAARRRLNRGFEALALSPDETRLHLMFQSPLAHPPEIDHERARHVRLWTLDAATGDPVAQHLYSLDAPESFRRDHAKGDFKAADVKVGEITTCAPDAMLVLERGSETSKIYRIRIDSATALSPEHMLVETRPSVEELSASGRLDLPVLNKQLLFTSDHAPELGADIEGMTLLSPTELLLVSDNDFGVEGAITGFWRLTFAASVSDAGA